MARMVQCKKLNKEAEGMDRPPYPGDVGKEIYLHISKEAWQLWIKQQTILINEYRLSAIDPKAQTMLMQEMKKFLFSDAEYLMPGAYTPE
ncbi:MAG: oxidative damage protection protein [Methylococcales bacterium]|jgi:Fe-S cluster biosynthesis and repair protein YggX|nr:oxidative damage protection protein [Methylococcales bacterium]MBT7443937.1 oxidative damage protection protein [Methylococcales bacterium]